MVSTVRTQLHKKWISVIDNYRSLLNINHRTTAELFLRRSFDRWTWLTAHISFTPNNTDDGCPTARLLLWPDQVNYTRSSSRASKQSPSLYLVKAGWPIKIPPHVPHHVRLGGSVSATPKSSPIQWSRISVDLLAVCTFSNAGCCVTMFRSC